MRGSIHSLIQMLDERFIASQVGIPYDQARAEYRLRSIVVRSVDEFEFILTDFYSYMQSRCMAHGGRFDPALALSAAKDLLEQSYRQQHRGTLTDALNSALTGTNSGMMGVLDTLYQAMKLQATSLYVRHVFESHMSFNSWDDKVEMLKQFFETYGRYLSPDIRRDQPERYARDVEPLIRSYTDGLRQIADEFRRL